MEESIHNAREELKRVDHLIYVSLKYTRTADVLHSVIVRLIDAYDWMMEALLRKLKDENKISEVPEVPLPRAHMVKENYTERFQNAMDFYLKLRKIKASEYTGAHEFRRNVLMSVKIDDEMEEVTIDTVMDYYKMTTDFMEIVEELIDNA